MDDHRGRHDSSSPQPQPPPPPDNSLDTYILQIPRDQIYRVPPPENAEIVRKLPVAPKKKKKHCDPLYCFLYLILAIILIFIATIILILYILLHLKTPQFSVTGLTFKNSSNSSTSKHANISYDVTMKVHNPNNKMRIIYENGGNVSLLFKKDKLGSGKYPSISQEPNESITLHAVLSGSVEPLPGEIQKMVKNTGKATEGRVTLSLAIVEPVELKGVITTKKRMTVMCDFGVNMLASTPTKILSQECRTEFFFEKQKVDDQP